LVISLLAAGPRTASATQEPASPTAQAPAAQAAPTQAAQAAPTQPPPGQPSPTQATAGQSAAGQPAKDQATAGQSTANQAPATPAPADQSPAAPATANPSPPPAAQAAPGSATKAAPPAASTKKGKKGALVTKPAPAPKPPPLPEKPPVRNRALDQLKPLEGTWTCTGRTFGPGPEHATSATLTFAWQLDGFWLEVRYEEPRGVATMPVPVRSVAHWGFDALQQGLVANEVDNLSGDATATTAGWEGDKLILQGTAHRYAVQFEARDTWVRRGEAQLAHTLEASVNGNWVKLHEDSCNRQPPSTPVTGR
jgi:hypothetical protein